MTTKSLKSSIVQYGKTVDEVIQFSGGNKKTVRNIITASIKESEFTMMETADGKVVYINRKNVDWFEVI